MDSISGLESGPEYQELQVLPPLYGFEPIVPLSTPVSVQPPVRAVTFAKPLSSTNSRESTFLEATTTNQMLIHEITDEEHVFVDSTRGPVHIWLDSTIETTTTNKVTIKDLSQGSGSHPIFITSHHTLERYHIVDPTTDHRVLIHDSQHSGAYIIKTRGGAVSYIRLVLDDQIKWVIASRFEGDPR